MHAQGKRPTLTFDTQYNLQPKFQQIIDIFLIWCSLKQNRETAHSTHT